MLYVFFSVLPVSNFAKINVFTKFNQVFACEVHKVTEKYFFLILMGSLSILETFNGLLVCGSVQITGLVDTSQSLPPQLKNPLPSCESYTKPQLTPDGTLLLCYAFISNAKFQGRLRRIAIFAECKPLSIGGKNWLSTKRTNTWPMASGASSLWTLMSDRCIRNTSISPVLHPSYVQMFQCTCTQSSSVSLLLSGRVIKFRPCVNYMKTIILF